MPGATNFVQPNPSAANQQNDATFASDPLTTGGIGTDAVLPSPWLNKIWFQSGTFVAAIAAVISGWASGYTITDTSISALETQLTNFFTLIASGISGWTFGNNANGYWSKDPTGKITQWGTLGSLANNTPTSGTFPTAFSNAASVQLTASDNSSFATSGNPRTMGCVVSSTSAFTILASGSGSSASWIAVGY